MDVSKKYLQNMQVFLVLFFLGTTSVNAQNPLERRVTLSSKQSSVKEVLQEIEKKAHLSFSYNPEQIQDEKMVEAVYDNKPVRFILDRIFKGWVDYRAKGNYIILHPAKKPPVPEPRFQKIRISGYVLNNENGVYLNGVSIYDTISFYSAVSDVNGHFELELGENSNALYLMVNKQGYQDTAYFIRREGFQSVELRLKPIVVEIPPAVPDTLTKDSAFDGDSLTTTNTKVNKWKEGVKEDYHRIRGMLSGKLRFNATNINDTFFRKVQFSLVPGISTNKLLAGNVVNDYSMNLIGGYSKGVNKAELGGIFNLDEGDVRYFQAAGIFNVVGGNVSGFQGAGIFNVSEGNVLGAQAAGIFNVTEGSIRGFQGAGIFNVTEGEMYGAQAAGIFNVSEGKFHGAQLAGIFNIHSKRLYGTQAAGIWNAAEEVYGLQIAGIFNVANYVKGAQIGLLNFSDSIDGVPVGLFSFSKKGYHKWEIGADELFYTRTALRTGGHWFHNILQIGMDPRTSLEPLWFAGYGIGTSIPIRRSYFDIDLTASYIAKGKPDLYLSSLSQLYMGMDFYLMKKVSIAAGITLNVFVVDETHPDFSERFNPIHPSVFVNQELDGSGYYRIQSWIGGKVALRFF